jgi:2-amino-4-hydroxy-6-hydroxymethyldihydropteridine diphosphokinase
VSRRPARDEAWIGVGSNLGDREATIADALRRMNAIAPVLERSPLLETEPWGVTDQPWFLNGVARLRWSGSAEALVAACLGVERSMGRVRAERNGPRLIDVDVLIAGSRTVAAPHVRVPHPGIASRRSVLEPWAQVAPDLLLPALDRTVGALRDAAVSLPGQGVRDWKPVSCRTPRRAGTSAP